MKEPGRSNEETPHKIRGTRLPHLRAIRELRFLTQERLSELSRVSRTTIYRLEGGERGARDGTVSKLARALGVWPDELVDGERYPRCYYPWVGAGLPRPARRVRGDRARQE